MSKLLRDRHESKREGENEPKTFTKLWQLSLSPLPPPGER